MTGLCPVLVVPIGSISACSIVYNTTAATATEATEASATEATEASALEESNVASEYIVHW